MKDLKFICDEAGGFIWNKIEVDLKQFKELI